MKLSTVFLVAFSSLALAVATPDTANLALRPVADTPPSSGKPSANGQKNDKKIPQHVADGPLAQNVPPKYNKHREKIPVFKNNKGACACRPAVCPPSRMRADLIKDCESSHAWACWRQNSSCPKPVIKKKKNA